MIPVTEFAGREVAVFGLGRTGLSAALALKAGGAFPIVGDDSQERREAASALGLIAVDLIDLDWTRFVALVLSPGIPFTHPEPHPVVARAHAMGLPVIGDIELFTMAMGPKGRRKARLVGITGTNGKSTTTALIGHVLQRCGLDARVCGNIGDPVLAQEPPGQDTVYVLELSSFQLDLSYTLAPDVAVLLNISQDHLDRHGSMEGYAAVKARIFNGQQAEDVAVIGVDDEHSMAIHEFLSEKAVPEGVALKPVSVSRPLEQGFYVEDGILYEAGPSGTRALGDLRTLDSLPGIHNWQNAAAAAAAVQRFVPDTDKIMAGLRSFPGLANRLEPVATVQGIRFINDSKATNADAAARALASFEEIYWIAGGRPKDGGIDSLEELFPRIKKAYLIGEAAPAFAATLKDKTEHTITESLDRAVATAFADARKAGSDRAVVLFSPACASFDQFKDFEARGDAFRTFVRAVEQAVGGQTKASDATRSGAPEPAR